MRRCRSMAGAGKTTFVTALYTYMIHVLKKKVYAINLDPAVDTVPFPANIGECADKCRGIYCAQT